MKLHKLNRGPRDNRYCGPAVISFVTGISTTDAAALIRKKYGRAAVRGSTTGEVRGVLQQCGYHTIAHTRYRKSEQPTLAGWLKDTVNERTPGRVFLLIAGNHWQLITGRRYACGRIGDIVSIKDERVKRRARVEHVWEVIQTAPALAATKKAMAGIEGERKTERKINSMRSNTRARTMRLAGKHGIEIDVDNFGGGSISIYLAPPDWVIEEKEAGNLLYESVCYDWTEAWNSVSTIVEAMKEKVE